jgi:hypothetical protein
MRGSIRFANRWVPFRADELLAPLHGYYWPATVASGLLRGSDVFHEGAASMAWRLLGPIPVSRARGPDVARGATGGAVAEGIWLPTALLPRYGVDWRASDDEQPHSRHPNRWRAHHPPRHNRRDGLGPAHEPGRMSHPVRLVNHSYDHRSFTGQSTGEPALSRGERLDQLARTEAAVGAAANTTTLPWFRPPYGDEDPSVRADVAAAGYRYELLWTVDSLGWRGISPDEVVQRCLKRAVPGAIFLLHVGAESTDHDALQRIIDRLRARGFGFATVEGIT